MKHLYVMDPLEVIQVNGDSTYMLMLEANKRGWETFWCTPTDLFAEDGKAFGVVQKVQVSDREPHFVSESKEERFLGDFQVVWMRKDPPFDMDYIFSTYLLDLIPKTTLVLNDPKSIRNCNEKMFALQFPQFSPKTLVTREIQRARQWAAQFDKVVIKPWDGNGGRGVLVTSFEDPNFRSMVEILTSNQSQYILVQQYIPEIKNGDKRIILVDGEAVGQILRVPQKGDHRGNIHVGARVEKCELTDREREICACLGPVLKELRLLFVGIDTIGDRLTEINVTSPTGIQEINSLLGIQVEKILSDQILCYYERDCAQDQ